MNLFKATMLGLALAALSFSGASLAGEVEDKCKAEAVEDGVPAEEMKAYIEACVEAKKQEAGGKSE